MSKHILGSDRILHEGAGYRNKYAPKSQNLPVGSRENPSNPKPEGVDAVYIPDTAKWMRQKQNSKDSALITTIRCGRKHAN